MRVAFVRMMVFTLMACCVAGPVGAQEKAGGKKEEKEAFEAITQKQIDAIDYEDAMIDEGFVTPLARDLEHFDEFSKKRMDEIRDQLENWTLGQDPKLGQRVRYWMSLCTIADLGRAEFEAEMPYVIFEKLQADIPTEQLKKTLAYIVLHPNEGKVTLKMPEIGAEEPADEPSVRERHVIYAKKLLGRLVGKLPPKE